MNIAEAIEKTDILTKDIYNKDINFYEAFLGLYPYIKSSYEEFISLLPDLNAIGINIKLERLVQDMRDISDAIEKKDKVLLFDTLNYRVKETLGWYMQIKNIMEEE